MCVDRVGRVQVTFAVLLAVAVPAAMLVHGKATAYMDSQLAAAALTKALLALPQNTALARTEEAGATETSATTISEADSAALLKVVDNYRQLLSEGKADLAWHLLHPDTYGGKKQEAWVKQQEELHRGPLSSDRSRWSLLLYGKGHRIVETMVADDLAHLRLVMDVEDRSTVVLRRRGGEWAVDLAETTKADVENSMHSRLKWLEGDDPVQRLLGLTITADDYGRVSTRLPITSLPVEGYRREVTSMGMEGDGVRVDFVARGEVHFLVPVEFKEGEWQPDWRRMEVLDPKAPTRAPRKRDYLGEMSPITACAWRMKELGLAMAAYRQDYDGCMPIADRWCDATLPYARTEDNFSCPADDGDWSYALNFKLSRQPMRKVASPVWTVMLFESEPSRRNAWDQQGQPGTSLADPARHGGANNFCFADGHVRALRNSEVQPGMYRLVGNPGLSRSPKESVTY
jgi:prepilin-type processing-associated H-X9-DG protein